MVRDAAVDLMVLEPKPWLEIDLDAISRNVRALKRRAGVPLLAVVKCDGYGHG
ncbi:MAG TPA: alanine racemase, partial [Thermoplasmata archaeon]|nr:alanine racemase [Thermoplasmata archaeon]